MRKSIETAARELYQTQFLFECLTPGSPSKFLMAAFLPRKKGDSENLSGAAVCYTLLAIGIHYLHLLALKFHRIEADHCLMCTGAQQRQNSQTHDPTRLLAHLKVRHWLIEP